MLGNQENGQNNVSLYFWEYHELLQFYWKQFSNHLLTLEGNLFLNQHSTLENNCKKKQQWDNYWINYMTIFRQEQSRYSINVSYLPYFHIFSQNIDRTSAIWLLCFRSAWTSLGLETYNPPRKDPFWIESMLMLGCYSLC